MMNAATVKTHFPLHITISSLFIGLIVILGVILSWQNYSKTSDIILSTADQMYEQITQQTILDFKATYHPAAQALGLIALSPIINADSLEQRLVSLELFSTALKNSSSVSAIQVGYTNGDYFIVRSLSTGNLRNTFSAPGNARYVTDHIYTDTNGERQLVRLYFDETLRETGRTAQTPTDYDPRQRSWYRQATEQPTGTKPYLFYFIGKIGTTVTLKTAIPGVVVATDVTLDQLSETISHSLITPSSEVVLVGSQGNVLAYPDASKLVSTGSGSDLRVAHLSELGSEVLSFLSKNLSLKPQKLDFIFAGQHWKGSIEKIARIGEEDLNVLMVSPLNELLSKAVSVRWSALVTTALIFLIAIPIVWYVATRISRPIRQLADEAGLISHFDFGSPVETHSFITEVDTLANSMAMMKQTINRFLTLINSLAGERNFDSLLTRITQETMKISQADGVLTYLVDENDEYLEPGTLHETRKGECSIDQLPRFFLKDRNDLAEFIYNKVHTIVEIDSHSESDLKLLLKLFEADVLTMVAVPLHNRQNESIGALCLLYRGTGNTLGHGQHDQRISFIKALSGFAAVTLESRQLLMMQEALLDAFIKLIAGAIDAKSPYTGGHCQRVPELTLMLAKAACESNEPRFRDFQLKDEEKEALHIASWLHDCGKVTTPEYVVDKATKLETLYDRIHEIRMRFEVFKRDASIHYWQQVASGGDRNALKQNLEQEWRKLDEEFAFIAECNEGGEFMAPDKIARLHQIAERTWTRTLDDRIGISWEEKQRKDKAPASPLPVQEKLLDNKAEHLIEREPADLMPEDNPWGFKLDVPKYKFNRGELYNLEIARGTLTPEERYKINEHMVQTIIMLEKMPYPKHLRDVPMIAGCHHETMTGSGYPKRLTRDQMPLTARMMAIADIFEALTASDRPYKKAKTLSEAIRILSFMRNDEHIDPDLFELFLSSGTWLEYGRRFLQPSQIDEVDVSRYLNHS